MDPRSEVLLRQAELFQGSVLLAGLPADDLLGRLPEAHGWCWHAGDQAALDARFPERSQFGVNVPEREFDTAVVFLPKAKDLTDYVLNAVASRLAGREVYLVGEKRSGIEGASKQLNPFGKPRKLDSARHCQLWQVTVIMRPKPSPWKAWPKVTNCRSPRAADGDQPARRVQSRSLGSRQCAAAGTPGQTTQRPFAGFRLRRRGAGSSSQAPLPAQHGDAA